jgi:hypothetical protein
LVKRKYTAGVETRCPYVVSSASGWKIVPVAAQRGVVLGVLAGLHPHSVGEDVIAGVVFLLAERSSADRLIN